LKIFALEINVAPLVIQMTRRFSQMLMAFLFPNKTQQNPEISHGNKSSIKHPTSTSYKRRTRSTEVRKRIDLYFIFFRNKLNSENEELSFLDHI
jgi:hypothetical protein